MLWLVKVWQVSSCGKFMQHLETCLLLTAGCTKKGSCYQESSVIHGWFVYRVFWLRDASFVKVGNPISDGIVFVFHLVWCGRRLKSLKRFWSYLVVFSASRMVSLSNYCIWCLFFISNFMKSSTVYAAILCTFVRFETMIWPSIRFDISLQNFKKPLDIFSHRK